MHIVNAPVLEVWTMLSDEQVVTRVLAGQTALFEVLMRRHNERIYRAARAILRDEHEAEDVMQQAYVNAYSHLRQFDGRSKFSTWLTRIAVHEALARARHRGRYMTMDGDESSVADLPGAFDAAPDPERLAISHELGALVESAVDRLPDGTREVFMLRQVEGMSTEEVAVRAQRQRGRRQDTTVACAWRHSSRALRARRACNVEHIPLSAAEMRPRCERRSRTDLVSPPRRTRLVHS